MTINSSIRQLLLNRGRVIILVTLLGLALVAVGFNQIASGRDLKSNHNDDNNKQSAVRSLISHNRNCHNQNVSQSEVVQSRSAVDCEHSNNNLRVLKSSFTPDDSELLKYCDNFFYKHDEIDQQYTIAELGLMALTSMVYSAVYRDAYVQRYDTYNELKLAAGSQVNQELCLRQLEHLNERASLQKALKYNSKDLNLYQLFDTYGRISSGLLLGNGYFEGMYSECIRLKIKTPEGKQAARYCVASMKHVNWLKIDKFDLLNLKFAVCLPKSCDSFDYKNKYQLVEQLIEHQVRRPEEGQSRLTNLYCLPDEDSPLRSISHWPASLWTLVGLISWICVLIYATIQYELNSKRQQQQQQQMQSSAIDEKGFGLTNGFVFETNKSNTNSRQSDADDDHQLAIKSSLGGAQSQQQQQPFDSIKIYKLLSITNNLKLLFDTSKESSLMNLANTTAQTQSSQTTKQQRLDIDAESNRDNLMQSRQCERHHQLESPPKRVVDLRCIEGIKVIAMCYVIMGHVLMCITSMSSNGREFASTSSMSFWMANLVPAFAVNAFFTITGILTCYLMFKQNQSYSFIQSPMKWLLFIIYRYMRIMPMYALVVLYTKSLAKFAGSGPLWDYGTTSLGQRKSCQLESWWTTFLFKANFVPPLEHCIPSAWYLANDFQFFIVTPIFLACLNWRPRCGEQLIKICALAGYLAGIYTIIWSDVDDLRPIARFAPHGFKTYISHFSNNYTQPQYRIPAYLIGLLIGHKLYLFEQRAPAATTTTTTTNCTTTTTTIGTPPRAVEADWPQWFKRYAMAISLGLIAACCITPFIGSRLELGKRSARLLVALVTNSYHIMFSSAIGIYILLATTGYGSTRLNRLLASSSWKPFARVSLCAVLINVEVINYIVQGNANLHYITNQYQVGLNILAISATYLVAIIVCVLFEAPIRGSLNVLMKLAAESLMRKRKVK